MSIFHEPIEGRAHERRLERELEAARLVVEAARATRGGMAREDLVRLGEALDAYDGVAEAVRREPSIHAGLSRAPQPPRPGPSRDHRMAQSGWQRGHAHRVIHR